MNILKIIYYGFTIIGRILDNVKMQKLLGSSDDIHIYINLRRSRDGSVFVCSFFRVRVFVTFASFI